MGNEEFATAVIFGVGFGIAGLASSIATRKLMELERCWKIKVPVIMLILFYFGISAYFLGKLI